MRWNQGGVTAPPCILQFIGHTVQVAALAMASYTKTGTSSAKTGDGTRGALYRVEVLNMKKYLLLPLVALGLVAWVPNQAKAGVHVSVGFGAPAYYGPYYGPYYPSYYYGPYWHRWHHHRYHHWHQWHRW